MIITRVEVQDFGPYKGKHEINFGKDGLGVHLLRGDNGQGKTSLQRAILWGLYGKVVDRKGQSIRATSLLNHTAKSDDRLAFGVKIYFEHEGRDWIVTRKTHAKTHQDAAYDKGIQLSVVADGEPQPNPEHIVERILPADVSRFFFFDGEMLRDYEELLDQSSKAMTLLRDGIERVLGIPYLRTARDDLKEVQRRFEGERNRLVRRLEGQDYQQLAAESDQVNLAITESEQAIQRHDDNIRKLEVDSDDLKRKQADLHQVAELANKRITIESEIKTVEAAKDRHLAVQQTEIASLYKTLLVNGSVSIVAQLDARHDKIMEKYNQKQKLIGRREDLEAAIASKQCKACGTELDPSGLKAHREDLKDVKARIADLTEVPEPNLDYEQHVNRLKQGKRLVIPAKKFEDLEAETAKCDHKLAKLRAALKDVEAKLEGVDEDEPRRLQNQITKIREEIGRLKGLREAEDGKRLLSLQRKAELDQKMSGIDETEINILASRIELAKGLADLFGRAVEKYRNDRRAHVEKKANEIFARLRSKSSFAKLVINEQFGLNIVTEQGVTLDRAEWRSSGEEQVVALALIGALNECANLEAPVFMDTPFGRLDTKHGKNVLTYLPEFASQVVLMVTDREFRPGDEKYLEGKVRTDLTIEHMSEKEGSRIYQTMGRMAA